MKPILGLSNLQAEILSPICQSITGCSKIYPYLINKLESEDCLTKARSA